MTNSVTTKIASAIIAFSATTMSFAEVANATTVEFSYTRPSLPPKKAWTPSIAASASSLAKFARKTHVTGLRRSNAAAATTSKHSFARRSKDATKEVHMRPPD